ncbi:MAG TPA: stage II sporulation protein R [Candidatus Blautia merdavium]|uniref:Stage II sporulation protein R n=1 Tax=Candidatus Blautia merdavium TaxID=2838494 RepID=A0A9D2PTH2_9FIRM|nr:stage II sporulation protein R [Candidatus Blautia merdavium]
MKFWEFKNKRIFLAAVLIGLAGTLFLAGIRIMTLRRENEELKTRLEQEIQQGIAGEIFRLHVIANSDTQKDQELKLEVKNQVVDFLEETVGETHSAEETKEAVLTHLAQIEEEARDTVEEKGYDYPVQAVVEKTYFPEKTYGDCTFPAGEYEALIIRIGDAKGKNWWCVLYPSLCFLDDTYAVVTEEKKEELQKVLTREEFLEVMQSPQEKKKVRIGFRWF